MIQGARGWCTGMTQRERIGREVGEGCSGWGTHVHPWWIHVNVWQNQKKKITYFHLSNDFLLVYGVYNMSFQMTVVLYDLAVFLL